MPAVELSVMTMRDYDEAAALWASAEGVVMRGADEPEPVARYLARNPGMSFVARDAASGRLVGAVLCGHDGRRGFLHHLAVAPSHRRAGVGRALAERCASVLVAAGIGKCHLMVLRDNDAARAFWTRLGWEARGDVVLMSRTMGAANP